MLKLVAWGYSNMEIARRLNISVKTTEFYRAGAVEKLICAVAAKSSGMRCSRGG